MTPMKSEIEKGIDYYAAFLRERSGLDYVEYLNLLHKSFKDESDRSIGIISVCIIDQQLEKLIFLSIHHPTRKFRQQQLRTGIY